MPTEQTAPRPDLAAFDYATRAPFTLVAKELIDILGVKLIAYISGVRETGAVQQYAPGGREIPASSRVFDWRGESQR